MNILSALKKEQAKLAKKLEGVVAAIAALGGRQRRLGGWVLRPGGRSRRRRRLTGGRRGQASEFKTL